MIEHITLRAPRTMSEGDPDAKRAPHHVSPGESRGRIETATPKSVRNGLWPPLTANTPL